MTEERWLPVVGWEGLYEVSDRGRVKSLARDLGDKLGRPHPVIERVLRPTLAVIGYPVVSLHASGRSRWTITVHRLVATAFIENPNNHPFVNHKNSERTDNSVSNLEWCTHAENVAHAHDLGRLTGRPKGYVSDKRKFSDEQIREVRRLSKQGMAAKAIARSMSVGATAINNIIARRTYSDVL